MTDLRSLAHEYADRGWPVFPCEVKGKRPLGRLVSHGLKDASTDHDGIDRWWKAEPLANIGLPTGITFDVLDVDGDEGMAALAVEMPLDGPTIDGPTVTTGKGAHVYVAPTGLGNRARFLSGCDWRGNGGYVVAAGSIHPSGAIYGWKCGADDPEFGMGALIRPAPAWLLDLLNRRPASVEALPRSVSPQSDRSTTYGRRALEAECGRVVLAPVGQRNDTLNRASYNLGQLVAGGALGVDEVIDALLVAAERAGLEVTEARKTIASGLRGGAANPRKVAS